jgi:hypothetical protein
MEEEIQYIISFESEGNPLDGGKYYKLHLPENIPANNFWSIIVYDNQSRLIIQTDQKWPSVFSNCKRLAVNPDGSVDVSFGPSVSDSKEGNWIKTIPGKGWNMIMRLYGHTEPSVNTTWKPGEIQRLNN